jgi:hypothetical protein
MHDRKLNRVSFLIIPDARSHAIKATTASNTTQKGASLQKWSSVGQGSRRKMTNPHCDVKISKKHGGSATPTWLMSVKARAGDWSTTVSELLEPDL